MNIVLLFNGLGNQMSQYAFYLAKRKHCRFTIPVFYTREGSQHNGFELDRIFGICLGNRYINYIFSKLYLKYQQKGKVYRMTSKLLRIFIEKDDYIFDFSNLKRNDGLLDYYWGGWHSERYFTDIRNQIQRTFEFKEEKLNADSKRWAELIKKCPNSCSLHIRRGDFVGHPMFDGIATDAYYKSAIEKVKDLKGEQEFFIFSNDIDWCRNYYGEDHFHFIDCNHGIDSWQDMYLMSICHNHINANSTFSWWGSWLCPYEDSVTIVPERFSNNSDTPDFYPDSWLKISNG